MNILCRAPLSKSMPEAVSRPEGEAALNHAGAQRSWASAPGFVGDLGQKMGIGQMAVDAGELLVVGLLPGGSHLFHAVAGRAEFWIPGAVIPDHRQGGDDDADDDTGGKGFLSAGWRYLVIFPASFGSRWRVLDRKRRWQTENRWKPGSCQPQSSVPFRGRPAVGGSGQIKGVICWKSCDSIINEGQAYAYRQDQHLGTDGAR